MSREVINERYEVRSLLGRGNQGEVVLAIDRKLGREVAVKLLSMKSRVEKKAMQSLKREARAMAAFEHPNVVSVYDYDQTHDFGQPFLVMEYLKGLPVQTLVQDLTDQECLLLVTQVGMALDQAHRRGLIHRDLKPANLMFVDRGTSVQRFVILDLGIAKLLETTQPGLGTIGSMTFSGAGTPLYMSPEQIEAKPTDHRTDIYAMGSMIYELMSGTPPFANDSVSLPMLLNAVMQKSPRPLKEVSNRAYSDALSDLVMQTLAKDPEQRPSSMGELVSRFQSAIREALAFDHSPIQQSVPVVISDEVLEANQNSEVAFASSDSELAEVLRAEAIPTSGMSGDDTDRAIASSQESLGPIENASGTNRRWLGAATLGIILLSLLGALGWRFLPAQQADEQAAADAGNDERRQQTSEPNPELSEDKTRSEDLKQVPQPPEEINFGLQKLVENTPWTLKPDLGGEQFDSFELIGEIPSGLAIDTSGGRLNWTPNESQGPGEYQTTILAKRNDREVLRVSLVLAVEETNAIPVLKRIDKQRPRELEEFHYIVAASDVDEPRQELTYRFVDEAPKAASLDERTGDFRWTPGEEDGGRDLRVIIEVSDGIDKSTVVLPMQVEEVNVPPQFLPIGDQVVDELQQLAFELNASDVDAPSQQLKFQMTSTNLPGAQFDSTTGRFRWTPGEAIGPSDLTASFTVTDGQATDTIDLKITVNEVRQRPRLDPIETQMLEVGEFLELQVTAEDLDIPSGPISYALKNPSSRMTIDSETGLLQFLPGFNELGKTTQATVVAINSNGDQSETNLRVTVKDAGELITNSIGMKLRKIAAGDFERIVSTVYDTDGNITKEEKDTITIAEHYFIGLFEVTKSQFQTFVEETGYVTDSEKQRKSTNAWALSVWQGESYRMRDWRNPGFVQEKDHPVVCLTVGDMNSFCEWLSEKERKTYRLPSVNEWDIAARGGKEVRAFDYAHPYLDWKFYGNANALDGDDAALKRMQVCFGQFRALKTTGLNWTDGQLKTCAVGSYLPNGYGLFDIFGNAAELCSGPGQYDYTIGNESNEAWVPGYGGSWGDHIGCCGILHEHGLKEKTWSDLYGFRIVLEVDE